MAAIKPLLRFAPSPTGPLHLGGLRTALFNHAFARRTGGHWILRIEDTDTSRTVPHSSERLDLYHHYAKKLLDGGHAYRCFCSPDRLAQTRERLARAGLNSTYDKHCLSLSSEDVARRVRAGEKNVVRLNDSILPAYRAEPDLIFGSLRDSHASLPTDPVLLKSDLFPTYHLASVVDDHEMGITHVLRGEEWLASLPLHLDLYAALGLMPPHFAHLPLLLNPDGSKMSKRSGDVQVLDYMRRGWEPDAVLNWVALAGWGTHTESFDDIPKTAKAPDSTTVMSLPEIITNLKLDVLTHRRTILDYAKLEYINKHHLMRTLSTESGLRALALRAQGHVKDAFPHTTFTSVKYIEKAISALQGRLVTLMDLPTAAPYFFVPPAWADAEARAMLDGISMEDYQNAMRGTVERLKSASPWVTQTLADALHAESKAEAIKPAKFMTALRHAMSGTKNGPSIAEMMDVLGKQRTIARLEEAGSSSHAWFSTSRSTHS
ncbi:glutamyl-tRNA synthetase [Lactarius akahatsu]|uniref:Glutamyl-tRNA synthetase n=1 Tax=Lactarius akahatsu TaxID=416441 RepID=A0AAD4LG40_9AGAM|nr:glutamyl-tRNA synthetase [Lactarius akahatsu]